MLVGRLLPTVTTATAGLFTDDSRATSPATSRSTVSSLAATKTASSSRSTATAPSRTFRHRQAAARAGRSARPAEPTRAQHSRERAGPRRQLPAPRHRQWPAGAPEPADQPGPVSPMPLPDHPPPISFLPDAPRRRSAGGVLAAPCHAAPPPRSLLALARTSPDARGSFGEWRAPTV